uniref:Uncharacterized protein n=1 Tax=Cacopsylla melanoneura TaxID=428564 RepID=A0A8D8WQU1_9HEMI
MFGRARKELRGSATIGSFARSPSFPSSCIVCHSAVLLLGCQRFQFNCRSLIFLFLHNPSKHFLQLVLDRHDGVFRGGNTWFDVGMMSTVWTTTGEGFLFDFVFYTWFSYRRMTTGCLICLPITLDSLNIGFTSTQ